MLHPLAPTVLACGSRVTLLKHEDRRKIAFCDKRTSELLPPFFGFKMFDRYDMVIELVHEQKGISFTILNLLLAFEHNL